jgi:hypothetical protein
MELQSLLFGLLIISAIALTVMVTRFIMLKQIYLKNEIEYKQISFENQHKTAEYSTQLLELIRNIVAQIAVVKYRNFAEANDMSKVTESMIKNLIKDIAESTHRSLNLDNMLWVDTLYTREFIENYIIDVTVMMVKASVHKTLEEN